MGMSSLLCWDNLFSCQLIGLQCFWPFHQIIWKSVSVSHQSPPPWRWHHHHSYWNCQCGIAMVGGADFIKTGDEEGEGAVNKAVIGDIIIVCAQVIMMLLMPMMRMMRRWRTDSCRRHHDHLHPANVACGLMVFVCLYFCWENHINHMEKNHHLVALSSSSSSSVSSY